LRSRVTTLEQRTASALRASTRSDDQIVEPEGEAPQRLAALASATRAAPTPGQSLELSVVRAHQSPRTPRVLRFEVCDIRWLGA
jgi:hypothetical protein